MKKNKKLFILSIILVVLLISVSGIFLFKSDDREYIDVILSSSEYSYLSTEAKDYIKEVYDKTGEVILTEKNKEENKPYLNPEYVDYLELSDVEKEDVDIIPTATVVDYTIVEAVEDNLPVTYNLNDVNGKNYLTPFNNQDDLGLCWSFASLQQAESYLMVKDEEGYSDSTDRFSIRQMDYATSSNGIKNYENENGFRTLTSGGNFNISSLIMSYGLTMVEDSFMPYNDLTQQKDLVDILNFSNSKYELNASIMMPILSKSSTEADRESYNSIIKQNIIKYGGAYVGTVSPNGSCGFKNSDGTYAMVDEDNCTAYSILHAMQIIGWDDNYEYSYCRSGRNNLEVNDSGSCEEGTLVSGKGAWILRNSWGEESEYKYVYLGYSSYGLEINFTTSLSEMSERTWDNLYHKNMSINGTLATKEDSVIFSKKINSDEMIEKIKFISVGMNGSYNVSIETENNKYTNIETVEINYPGMYTIDLSSKNILLDSKDFKVIIKSNNGTNLLSNSISVFTSNTNKNPIIKTENLGGNSFKVNSEANYEFIVYSDTKNINSNSIIDYSIYSGDDDYSNFIVSVDNSEVAENNVNATVILSKDIPVGNYTLKTIYDNNEFESVISIPNTYSLEGEGTEKNPYLIYTEEDLEQMRYDLDAYYMLKNDIVLTEEWVPIGTYSAPFRGGFDGDNHTISGLNITENVDYSVGFFGYVEAKYLYYQYYPDYISYNQKSYIKNVTFKDSVVSNTDNAGILIGQLIFDTSKAPENASTIFPPVLTIDNVHFIGGSVTSFGGDAGVIIGNFNIIPAHYSDNPRLIINNMYSSATVSGFHSAGLIGYINDSYDCGRGVSLKLEMSNFQNVGILKQSIFESVYNGKNINNYSSIVGGLYGNMHFVLSNYIINSIFDDVTYNQEFFQNNNYFYLGGFDSRKSTLYNSEINNGYYLYEHGSQKYNDGLVKASEIKDKSLYDEWEEFDKYWKIETIDDIVRIPVLKGIDYNYTNVSDIDLKLYDKVSLLDYIEGNSKFQYVNFKIVTNDKVVDINYTFIDKKEDQMYKDNIEITALNKGTAVVRITNEYDGFDKEININVTADKVEKPVITYYFDQKDNTETYTQTLNALETFTLTKNKFNKLGYKFKGWNTIADGTGISYSDEELFENGIDEDLKLYAQWESIKYLVKFDANGGIGDMEDRYFHSYSVLSLSYNKFTRDYYSFIGWNTKADGTGISYADNSSLEIDENLFLYIDENDCISLYAQWEKIKYVLRFNANGGIGDMDNVVVDAGSDVNIPDNKFEREGYTFKGWNTKADGTGDSYTNHQKVTVLANIDLYAIWEINKYKITFNSNNGKGHVLVQNVLYHESVSLNKNKFTYNGYTFKEWNTKADGTGDSYTDEQIINAFDNLELYAIWESDYKYIIYMYSYDEVNGYISSIRVNTDVDEFKGNIQLYDGYSIDVESKEIDKKNLLYTGGKTRIYNLEQLEKEFINIVIGDINGDAFINSGDLLKIKRHLLSSDILSGEFYVSADVNYDKAVNSGDLLKIRQHLLGLELIS